MFRRVSFSENHPEFDDIGEHYDVFVESMNLYYSQLNPTFISKFKFYSREEVERERESRLEEIDASLALTLLASIEASFRIDYLQRCYREKKDLLSRNFFELYERKGSHVSFENEILDGWKRHSNVPLTLLEEIKGAFKYRHWLAHGRYWIPRLGRRYDFSNIFGLALRVDEMFPFEKL